MKSLDTAASRLVRIAKVIVGLADTYDNEETVKGCYELNDIFKAEVRDLYIKSRMEADEKSMMCQISRDLRDARIAEIMEYDKEGYEDQQR